MIPPLAPSGTTASPSTMMATTARFLAFCDRLAVPHALAVVTAEELQQAYTEPQRHYHTLSHISALLEQLDQATTAVLPEEGRHAVEAAIWFHDVVYDPVKGAPWNEEESERVWVDFVAKAGGALTHLESPVSTLILTTISHQPPLVSSLPANLSLSTVHFFLDSDISILAATPLSYYQVYAEAIRREYAHVPLEAYREGRAKVLSGFLRREKLFFGGDATGTESDRDELARGNLRWEIKELQGGRFPPV